MNFDQWAERVFTVSEAGETVAKIQLISTDGGVWNTWTPPWPKTHDFCEDAARVLAELLDDLPAQDVQLIWIAYDARGNIIAQNTKAVRGKAKHASASALGGPGRALAESMNALAATMDRILATANTQNERLSQSLDQQHRLTDSLMQQLLMVRLEQLKDKPAIDPDIVKQGMDMLPGIIELILKDGRLHGKAA